MAWPAVVSNLKRYEIIELQVRPELYVEHVDGPPGYQIAVGGVEESKEAAEFFARSSPTRPSGAKLASNKHPTGKGASKSIFRLK
jgi:hypothetical protein